MSQIASSKRARFIGMIDLLLPPSIQLNNSCSNLKFLQYRLLNKQVILYEEYIMPGDETPKTKSGAEYENSEANNKPVSDIAFKEKSGYLERGASSLTHINSIILSSFKIAVIILLSFFILKLCLWTCAEENGFIIQPFKVTGIGEGLDGYSVAQLLTNELQRIQNIDQKASEVILFTGLSQRDQNAIVKESAVGSGNDGNEKSPKSGFFSSPSSRTQPGDFGFISPKGESLKYTISSMGTVDVGGSQFSPGSLILLFKEIMGSSPSPITGGIQRYNSTVVIIVTLEDRKSDVLSTWEIRRNITGDNETVHEHIPSMIRDLSFQVASDLGRMWQPETEFPETSEALKYLIQAQEAYLSYNRTKNISQLDLSSELALKAATTELNYDKPAEMLSEIGFFDLEHNQSKKAESIFRGIKTMRRFEGSMGLGTVFSREGRYADAFKEFDEATKINDTSRAAWNNRGGALQDLGRYKEALESFDKALELDPKYAYAWNNRGNALQDLGRYKEALESFDKALKLNSKYVYALIGKGNVLRDLGRPEEALESYNKALELDLNNAGIWNNVGGALQDLGRYKEALESYNKALELDPKYAYAWNNRGNVLRDLNRLEEALESYIKALELDLNNAGIWNNVGGALQDLGRPEEALESYNKALELDPKYAYAWNNRGNVLRDLNRLEEALESYNKSLELDPKYVYALIGKGNVLQDLGRPEEALESYNKALELDPKYAYAWNNRGNALQDLGRPEEALESYNKALELDRNNAGFGITWAVLSKI